MKEKKIFHVAHVTSSPDADTGFSRLYPKADGWYTKDSAGNEVRIEGIVVLNNAGTALDQKPNIQFLSPLTTAEDGDKIVVGVDTEGYSWQDAGTTPAGIKPVLDKDVHVTKITAFEINLDGIGDLETYLNALTLDSLWEAHSTDVTLVVPKTNKGIEVGGNFRVESDGKTYIDDLAEIVPVPLLVGTDGRIRTKGTVTTYTLTINMSSASGVTPSDIEGYVFISGGGVNESVIFTGSQAVISNLPDGEYIFNVQTEDYQPSVNEATISGANLTVTATLTAPFGQEPGDVVEGRTGELILTDAASNLTLAKPVAIVERGVNYSLTLPDAGDSQTVEMSARKAQTGGALTLVANGGFYMDGATGDVLTTTVKGAWAKVKAIEIGGVQKWAVIQDSGDWTLDTI